MASNNEWAPLPQRKNIPNRKTQGKILTQLKEMFGSNFELDIISSVARRNDWNLVQSIDTLITLSSNDQKNESQSVQQPNTTTLDDDSQIPAYDPWPEDDHATESIIDYPEANKPETNLLKFDEEELLKQQEELRKFEIAKDENNKKNKEKSHNESGQSQKVETASLCGLKVQYRPKGMENEHSDDDADVVVEEETSDYRVNSPESERISVCQFLAQPTQCPPKDSFPKVNYVNTPSPPRTPQHTTSTPSKHNFSPSSQDLIKIYSDIEKGYKILILMRGAPGSGKSYLAKKVIKETMGSNSAGHIFSTDDYFILINKGHYVFDVTKLSDAHFYNQNRVSDAMRQEKSPIIVDNTNTQAWEMHQYAVMAIEHGYIVETLEPNTAWFRNDKELEKRNKHVVPRHKIRLMLDRYEPNINGERLLRILKLRYSARNEPPQLRKIPPIPSTLSQEEDLTQKMREVTISEKPSSSIPLQRRVRRPKKPTDEERPQNAEPQLIDSDGLTSIAKEYANLDEADNNERNIYTQLKEANESWVEGSSYKEESLIDLMKLGAIGSERKVMCDIKDIETINLMENHNEKDLKKENSPTQMLKAIGSERKNSVHILDDFKNEEKVNEGPKVDVLHQCWDFTLTLNGKQIHSRLDSEQDYKIDDQDQDDVVSLENVKIELKEDEDDAPEEVSGFCTKNNNEENNEANIVNKESSTPSDKTNSDISLDRTSDVDMSQYEICNTDSLVEDKPHSSSSKDIDENVNVEMQPSGGFGSLFKFIKNSFLRNEKEKSLNHGKFHEDNSNSTDHLTEKLRANTSSASNTSTLEQTLSEASSSLESHESSRDTLSCKLSNFIADNKDRNLSCETQKIIELLHSSNTSKIFDISLDNEEFFEAQETIEAETPTRNEDVNVTEQLLDACSDFQLVEHHFTETKLTINKNEEQKLCNVVSEKTFIEQKKNLQVLEKSEEDEKVLKEPIDKVFSNKNIFPEKIEKIQNTATSNSHSNISTPDNVNLISWRESPFPLDDIVIPSASSSSKEVNNSGNTERQCNRETYTSPYDFNVAYVGGTDDYKVIDAFNRSINNGRKTPNDDEDPPLHKLMLHKGTMTNNTSILHGETMFDLEIDAGAEDRSAELIERFPHLPPACIVDVYDNMCKRDFNWTQAYLYRLQDDEATLTAATQDESAMTTPSNFFTTSNTPTNTSIKQRTTSSGSSSENTDSAQQSLVRNTRRDKSRVTDDALALKQHLESQFVLSEESYKPHTLRVKRWKNRQFDDKNLTNTAMDLIQFDDLPPTNTERSLSEERKPSRLDNPAFDEEQPVTGEDEDSLEDEPVEDEMMELKLGYDFIQVLESEFGNSNFQIPDGLFPVIQIRRSMAQELHALWIESMQQQLWVMQEQLDAIIAKDAEYAKSLEVEEARAISEPEVPSLKEIMDMEMALATYNNDFKGKIKKESHKEMALRVAHQTLHEMFPKYDRQVLLEIFEAHARNFDETVKVIEENCTNKSTITMADVLKKRKNLIDELQKESHYQTSRHNQLELESGRDEASGGCDYDDGECALTYEDAMESAYASRDEARRQLSLRFENYQKAAEHCRRKNPEVAAYYSDMAKLHMRNVELANSAAASAFLAAQAHKLESEDTLDLHYLHVQEAKEALKVYLDTQFEEMAKGARKQIFIITGRGARSNNGTSKIKPAIARELNSMNIRFSEVNPGMLKAFLRKK